jgi:integrase
MAVNLTESAIRAAAAKARQTGDRVELVDAKCAGLRLRLTPSGGAWALMCRDRQGQMRRFTIGAWPEKGISEARNEARSVHGKVRQDGADPVAERRRERAIGKAAKAGIGTLAALLALYERQRGGKLKAWGECRRRIASVFAPFLERPLAVLKAADLQLQADGWPAQQSAAAAVRYIRPVLKWAAQPGRAYVAAELAQIVPPATVGRRTRILSREELAALLPVLGASRRPYAAALRFMLLTLSRREEACAARWRDVDFEARTWTIRETKNGEPHTVPLSRQAIALLQTMKPENPKPEALIFATSPGAPLMNWDRETKALQRASGTSGWHRHDLRRTGATMLGEMGELPDIIEAALNHTSIRSPLAATYNRSRYRPQVAAALQRLADALDGIEAGAGEVLPLRTVG